MYAAAALAIDYGILPWGRRSTFRAIEKCMRLALATLETGRNRDALSTTPIIDPRLSETRSKSSSRVRRSCAVQRRQKVIERTGRARQKADGFKIKGETYIKPNRFKRWIPSQPERNALKEHKVIITDRKDTATVEKKIGGIQRQAQILCHRLSRPGPIGIGSFAESPQRDIALVSIIFVASAGGRSYLPPRPPALLQILQVHTMGWLPYMLGSSQRG